MTTDTTTLTPEEQAVLDHEEQLLLNLRRDEAGTAAGIAALDAAQASDGHRLEAERQAAQDALDAASTDATVGVDELFDRYQTWRIASSRVSTFLATYRRRVGELRRDPPHSGWSPVVEPTFSAVLDRAMAVRVAPEAEAVAVALVEVENAATTKAIAKVT